MAWKKYRVAIGLVLLVALGATAIVMARQGTSETKLVSEELEGALPEIKADDVDALEIRRSDAETVQLVEENGTWKVVAPVKAKADQSAVTTAVDNLGELTLVGVAATKKANHERLEVGGKKGIHVLPKRDGKTVAHLIIGTQREGNTMIRLDGEARVLSIEGSIRSSFDKELKNWRDRSIVDAEASRAREVLFTSDNGTFRFTRANADAEWAIAKAEPPIPQDKSQDEAQGDGDKGGEEKNKEEDKETYQSSKVDSVVSSLAGLRATDFAAPDMTVEKAGLGGEAATAELVLAPKQSDSSADAGATATSDGGPAAGDGGTAGGTKAERIVVRIGKATDDKEEQFYLKREGDEVIYIISQHLAEDFRPGPDAFVGSDGGGAKARPAGAAGRKLGGGGKKLPPGVMKKLKRQMGRRR